MAIQYQCESCRRPIEVDDEYAGRVAACPYCGHSGAVPEASTWRPERPTGAGPVSAGPVRIDENAGQEPAPIVREHAPGISPFPPPPPPQQPGSAALGNYALICSLIVVVLMAAMFVKMMSVYIAEAQPMLASQPATQPTTQQVEEIQKAVFANLGDTPWFTAASLGAMFFSLAGLILAIIGWRSGRGVWRCIVSCIICAPIIGCVVMSVILQVIGGVAV